MATRIRFRPTALWVALFACGNAAAQSTAPASGELAPVTVTGRSPTATASIGGFGDIPLARSPFQATVMTGESLRDSGGDGLTAATRFDASVSDAYNSEGYWTFFTVRGFVLDNRFNFRRDGLPINAETRIGLANKSAVEILKGTSGVQAGTSAPGGLVNLVVKRPDGNLTTGYFGWREKGTMEAAVDWSHRFGPAQDFGLRINAEAARIDPRTRDDRGNRHLLALAGDWRVSSDTLLEAEIEASHASQPSVPGFSLLGDRVPDPKGIDPRINLNNQAWSLPVVLDGTTASLRWRQRLDEHWRFEAHAGIQRLRSDDRVAFPFGCSAQNNYSSYCSNGTFDLYDYRSDGERRDTDAIDLNLNGKLTTGTLKHDLTTGVLYTRFRSRFNGQAYNYVGTGNIDGTAPVSADPSLTATNTNRDERSTELYVRDAIMLDERWGLWLGLRHSRLERGSVNTDGTEPVDYPQSFTTPWAALSYAITPELMAYASAGQGVESEVAPNRPAYINAGQPLPALKSRQYEIGLKQHGPEFDWTLTAFDIDRPQFADVGVACGSGADKTCTHQIDGRARHRGFEAAAAWKRGALALQGSLMLLDAKVSSDTNAAIDNQRPTNVPARTLKLNGGYAIGSLPGLALQAGLVYEGDRIVTPDNGVRIPGWMRLDLGARYQQRVGGTTLTWLAGIDNALDRRAWRESPYQYDHVYLFPLAPRTLRLSVQADL